MTGPITMIEPEAPRRVCKLTDALRSYFAAADASWIDVSAQARAAGLSYLPLSDAQAKAVDEFNRLRAALAEHEATQPEGLGC